MQIELTSIDDLNEIRTRIRRVSENEHLYINISSIGGKIFQGLALIDEINKVRNRGVKVVGHVYGICASMALAVLQTCDLRILGDSAIIMAHGEFKSVANLDEACKAVIIENLATIYSRRTDGASHGFSYDDWMEFFNNDDQIWYSANEAIEAGLADKCMGVKEYGKST